MKLLIQRKGCGWGGYHGTALVDTDKGIVVTPLNDLTYHRPQEVLQLIMQTEVEGGTLGQELDLREELREIMSGKYMLKDKNIRTSMVKIVPVSEEDIDKVLDTLKDLKDAIIVSNNCFMMDQQVDLVTLLDDEPKIVYSTEFDVNTPVSKELTDTLRLFIRTVRNK